MKLKICTDDFLEVCGKRGVCMLLVFGIALVIAGIVLLAVTQVAKRSEPRTSIRGSDK